MTGGRRESGAGPRARRAFTFIELMAVVVILGVLSSVSSLLLVNAIDGYLEAATTAQVHSDLSIAMDRLAREFRRIPPYPTVPGAVPYIGFADVSTVTWYDEDADAYNVALNGTDLELAADGGAAADLLTDVTAFTLAYADEDDDPLATPMLNSPAVDPIRRITIDITVTRKGMSQSLSAKVYVRSCMSGS